jgi:hypothetical protein
MDKININDNVYAVDSLSEMAKAQLTSLQFVELEISRLQAMIAALQTARNAYASALQESLPAIPDKVLISG